MTFVVRALVWILLVPAGAVAEPVLTDFNGTWRLDWDRSESFEPVLEVMEVNWFMRQLAGVATVDITLEALEPGCGDCPEKLRIAVSSPVADQEQIAVLDGQERPGEDPQGNPTVDRFHWNERGELEMSRRRKLPSGKTAQIIEVRRPGPTPDTLDSVISVSIDGEPRVSVNRVFARVDAN